MTRHYSRVRVLVSVTDAGSGVDLKGAVIRRRTVGFLESSIHVLVTVRHEAVMSLVRSDICMRGWRYEGT
jgi:hypothetical protein